jgi:hypothetical protein
MKMSRTKRKPLADWPFWYRDHTRKEMDADFIRAYGCTYEEYFRRDVREGHTNFHKVRQQYKTACKKDLRQENKRLCRKILRDEEYENYPNVWDTKRFFWDYY